MDIPGSGQEPPVGCCGRGNQPLGFVKRWEIRLAERTIHVIPSGGDCSTEFI